MELIKNLPVALAASTAFLAGLHGYANRLPNIRIYQNMCLFLVVFYLIGALVKWTAFGIVGEHLEKEKKRGGDVMKLVNGQQADAIMDGSPSAEANAGDSGGAGDMDAEGEPVADGKSGADGEPPYHTETGYVFNAENSRK
jgi:hypothetical protein